MCIFYALILLFAAFKCSYFLPVIDCRYTNFSLTEELRGKITSLKTRRQNVEYLLVKQIVLQTYIQILVS